jgi:hypothetical protein
MCKGYSSFGVIYENGNSEGGWMAFLGRDVCFHAIKADYFAI